MFLRHSFYSTEFHTERTIKHVFALKAGVKNTAEDIFGSELFSSEHKKRIKDQDQSCLGDLRKTTKFTPICLNTISIPCVCGILDNIVVGKDHFTLGVRQ